MRKSLFASAFVSRNIYLMNLLDTNQTLFYHTPME
jgi:hypothetical protein